MAGTMIQLDISQIAQAQQAIERYERLVAEPGVLLHTIGQHLVNTTEERFDRREAPDGTPWEPVSDEYARRKLADRATKRSGAVTDPAQILELTRDLRRGIRHQVIGTEVNVGSDREYAASHQFGRAGIPARPFLGISEEDEREIVIIFRQYLQL